jgi:large subunit ribosomal protein L18
MACSTAREKRHARVRKRVSGTATRPRLCVFRSLNQVYAQVIDDTLGQTLTSASTLDAEIKAEAQGKTKTERAKLVGALLAKRALAKGLTQVIFDRGGYKYHGRVKSLAEAAREGGLKF